MVGFVGLDREAIKQTAQAALHFEFLGHQIQLQGLPESSSLFRKEMFSILLDKDFKRSS